MVVGPSLFRQEGGLDPDLHPSVAARAWNEMQTAVVLWWLDEPGSVDREQLIETLVRLHPAVACARR